MNQPQPKTNFNDTTNIDTLPEPEHQNSQNMSVEEIDEIVLKPAYWRFDDYVKAKHDLENLIAERERLARLDELKESKNIGLIDEDYLGAFDKRLAQLQNPQEAEPGKLDN